MKHSKNYFDNLNLAYLNILSNSLSKTIAIKQNLPSFSSQIPMKNGYFIYN